MPFVETNATPFVVLVTTNRVPDQETLLSVTVVSPGVLAVQVMPSGDVVITPEAPTATNNEPFQTISFKVIRDTPLVRGVHVVPSGDVEITPAFPIATNKLLA